MTTNHTTRIDGAVLYLRSVISQNPQVSFGYADKFPNAPTEVVNMDTLWSGADKCALIVDLADGTTIRLDVDRYYRDNVDDQTVRFDMARKRREIQDAVQAADD